MVKVVILGAGNVAFHLTNNLLNNKEVQLIQVFNRNLQKIEYLSNKIEITDKLDYITKNADIYIIAIPDDRISKFSKQLNLPNKLVVHTSGSVILSDLKSNSNKGVFYMLQTFSKEKNINFLKVPICIEAENEKDVSLLKKLATSISEKNYILNSEQRKHLHTAAVFVNNFVNHLYHIGNEICKENDIPFEILYPLIKETAEKIGTLTPFEAQTGPARRNDQNITKKQQVMLPKNQKEIYKLLTQSILNTYGKKL